MTLWQKGFDSGKNYQCFYTPPQSLIVERSGGRVRYEPYLHDKWPYLLVLTSNNKHTEGFNLHYFPLLYYKIPIERYHKYSFDQWAATYSNLKKLGLFDAFFDEVENFRDKYGTNEARWGMFYRHIKSKRYFSIILPAYRRYFTKYLKGKTYE